MTTAMTPSGAVTVGIGTLLAADVTLNALATGGIWNGMAPVENNLPYCSYRHQAGMGPEWSFSQQVIEDLLFIVKGVDDTDGTQADAIAARARLILTDPTLTLGAGWTLAYCRPEGSMPPMQEPNGSLIFYHAIVQFRIKVFPG